jgi:hypothetical protein
MTADILNPKVKLIMISDRMKYKNMIELFPISKYIIKKAMTKSKINKT